MKKKELEQLCSVGLFVVMLLCLYFAYLFGDGKTHTTLDQPMTNDDWAVLSRHYIEKAKE